MLSVRHAFLVGVVGYQLIVSLWIKEHMLTKREGDDVDPVIKGMQRFPLRYLTNWTFTLLTLYFIMALVEEILTLLKVQETFKRKLAAFKNYLFTALAAPMALLVTIGFWAFWSYDRELIFPKMLDKVLPPWINHSLHTTTSLFVLMEMYLCYHKYPAFKAAFIGITAYLLIYSMCLVGTYFQSGIWLYPVFKVIDWSLRVAICIGFYLGAIGLYGAGYFLNKVFWDEKHASVSKKSTKKAQKKNR